MIQRLDHLRLAHARDEFVRRHDDVEAGIAGAQAREEFVIGGE